jgi:hypothetical protein
VITRAQKLRLATGVAESGDMLIREFVEVPGFEDVDLVEDLKYFMENDPKFYRKVLYPAISRYRKKLRSGENCEPSEFRGCVDQAASIYCDKFNIPGNPKSVFTDVDRDELAQKIFGQERQRIEDGVYDKDSK